MRGSVGISVGSRALAIAALAASIIVLDGSHPAAAYTFKILYAYSGGAIEGAPSGGLVRDSTGTLFGVTQYGGIQDCAYPGSLPCGTVFKLTEKRVEKALYAFKGQPGDGATPVGGLARDSKGDLFGTTSGGGDCNAAGGGCGTVFEYKSDGTYVELYQFCSPQGTLCADGENPVSSLIVDRQGNLFGTAQYGGRQSTNYEGGVVFEVTARGKFKVLHAFTSNNDGWQPQSALILDANGNLFGTTPSGGRHKSTDSAGAGAGVVYEIAADGSESIFHDFTPRCDPFGQCSRGEGPRGPLIRDQAGNFYGVTAGGGTHGNAGGTVFRLTPSGTLSVLYSFCAKTNCADGSQPVGGLAMDAAGDLFGTTEFGGANARGVVFELTPAKKESVLYSFCSQANCADGYPPNGGLIIDSQGNLYGETGSAGSGTGGTIFEVKK
jgi:uncharacterized repeat protein (TIGR03803 family)